MIAFQTEEVDDNHDNCGDVEHIRHRNEEFREAHIRYGGTVPEPEVKDEPVAEAVTKPETPAAEEIPQTSEPAEDPDQN